VNGFNSWKSGEIGDVERKHMWNVVHDHSCGKPGIVDPRAGHTMSYDQPAPGVKNVNGIWNNNKKPLKAIDVPIRVCNRQSHAVDIQWPGTYAPELCDVLRGDTE
jgi:hypothetical protein